MPAGRNFAHRKQKTGVSWAGRVLPPLPSPRAQLPRLLQKWWPAWRQCALPHTASPFATSPCFPRPRLSGLAASPNSVSIPILVWGSALRRAPGQDGGRAPCPRG